MGRRSRRFRRGLEHIASSSIFPLFAVRHPTLVLALVLRGLCVRAGSGWGQTSEVFYLLLSLLDDVVHLLGVIMKSIMHGHGRIMNLSTRHLWRECPRELVPDLGDRTMRRLFRRSAHRVRRRVALSVAVTQDFDFDLPRTSVSP